MTRAEAINLIKSINRHLRRKQILAGGLRFGLDYNTWHICHPDMSKKLDAAAQTLTGHAGRYLPRWRYSRQKPAAT